jgi:chlorite dismutase
MDVANSPKNPGDAGLRLVVDQKAAHPLPEIEKQFVNFLFLRVNPEWRKFDTATKSRFKAEFERVYDEFASDFLLFSYSLVGFDSKADLMIWRIGRSLDLVQEMTARLYRTELGSYLETVDNYLSITKKMMFVSGDDTVLPNDRSRVVAGAGKYHFVYPCGKHAEWYKKSGEERDALIEQNYMVGQKFQNIRIHLTHAFGFSEQEYLISFETDEPKDFLALAEELREMPASKFTLRGMPVYTCRRRSMSACLDALG